MFVLADSPTGYVKRLQDYTGNSLDSSGTDVGLCIRVVLDQLESLDSELQLYTDNFLHKSTFISSAILTIWYKCLWYSASEQN